MPRPLTLLWVVGVFVCFLDYPAISVGGSVLKVAFVISPLILACVLIWNRLRINKTHALLSITFIACVLPSVAYSTDFSTSIKFLFGLIACLAIMNSMYTMTRALGTRAVDMLIWIYRFSIIVTIPLRLSGLQSRGHFSLYEPSYWAIAMIPYYCVAFHRLLRGNKKEFLADALFILTAILISESVSMVLWVALSFAGILLAMRKVRVTYVVASAIVLGMFGAIAYSFNNRAQAIIDIGKNLSDRESVAGLLIFIAGNRVQRVLVAYRAFQDHIFLGVGLGALKNFTNFHLQGEDFSVFGSTAPDFEVSEPATNIFLELAAECGIFGLAAFLGLLRFISKQCKNKPAVVPFYVALWVTTLSLMIESSYLRPYVWMLYGISLGLSSVAASFPSIRIGKPSSRF